MKLPKCIDSDTVKMAASYFHDGDTQVELAAKMGVTQQEVSRRLRRLRIQLRKAGLPNPQRFWRDGQSRGKCDQSAAPLPVRHVETYDPMILDQMVAV